MKSQTSIVLMEVNPYAVFVFNLSTVYFAVYLTVYITIFRNKELRFLPHP